MLPKFICVISALLSGILILNAQSFDEKDFTLYTTKDGLSNNRVTDIRQDKQGYLWISTREGLNRFDGSSFQTFYADSSRNSLPRDELIKLRWIDDDQLAATTIGLHVINTRTLASRNIIIPAGSLKYEYKVNSIEDILSDRQGNLFLLTHSGFYQYHNNKLVFRFVYDKTVNEGLQFGRKMIQVGASILLSTYDGLYIYDMIKKKLRPVNDTDELFIQQIAKPKEWFWFMHGDRNSFSVQMEGASALHYYDIKKRKKLEIWSDFTTTDKFDWRSQLFYVNDSIYAINGMTRGFYLIQFNKDEGRYEIKPELYFKNHSCSSLFIDKDQRLWVATNHGLFAEKKLSRYIETFRVPQEWNPFNKEIYLSSFTTANDKLFAGSNVGVLVFDRATMRPLKQIPLFHSDGDYVYSTITVNPDTVFASAGNNLAWVNCKNLKSGKYDLPYWGNGVIETLSLLKDMDGGIYLSVNKTSCFLYRQPVVGRFKVMDFKGNKLFGILTPKHVTQDPEGNVWFGGHGFSRYNRKLNEFDLKIDSFPVFKMARKEVTSPVFIDRRIYFGLPENGLIIYDLDNKKFEQITREKGLPNNTIEALYHVKNKVWLATDNGLASFDLATNAILTFGVKDNMPSEPFTSKLFYYDTVYNYLYAGFNNTVVRFNPDKLSKNHLPPSFFIEKIKVSDNKVLYEPKDKITLLPRENNLIVNLASINYDDAYQQQFAYRLVNDGSEDWQMMGSQRNIILTNLPPGKHKLMVKVFVKNNSWPEQMKEILIYVRPPFWKTNWFISLIIALSLTVLYFLYKTNIRRIRQKANVDKQLAKLEMKGLHAQMNPHFMFNSLNSIREMILNNENKEASHYLSEFAHLVRTTLEHSSYAWISLRKTLMQLEPYIEMEKLRNSLFTSELNVDSDLDLDETLLPPMLIQPFIENAIWHGVSPGKKNIHVKIEFKKQGDMLVAIIDDNGIGVNQALKDKAQRGEPHRSVGISNINQRITLLNEKYSMQCSLEIKDKTELGTGERGTLVTLQLPLEIKEDD